MLMWWASLAHGGISWWVHMMSQTTIAHHQLLYMFESFLSFIVTKRPDALLFGASQITSSAFLRTI